MNEQKLVYLCQYHTIAIVCEPLLFCCPHWSKVSFFLYSFNVSLALSLSPSLPSISLYLSPSHTWLVFIAPFTFYSITYYCIWPEIESCLFRSHFYQFFGMVTIATTLSLYERIKVKFTNTLCLLK